MRRLLGLVLPLALLAAACGDDAEDATETSTSSTSADGGEGDEAATTTTAAPTTTTEAAESAGEGADGGDEAEGAGDVLLVADLTADAEVPGPGAAGGRGRFEAVVVDGELCIDMVVADLGDAVFGAHVHDGGPGVGGGVIIDLGEPSESSPSAERWVDACTPVPDDVIARLAAAPDQHYVNVHTPGFPDGAVRGQLGVASVFDRTLD